MLDEKHAAMAPSHTQVAVVEYSLYFDVDLGTAVYCSYGRLFKRGCFGGFIPVVSRSNKKSHLMGWDGMGPRQATVTLTR
jgi:hypothetical protein